MVSTEDDGGCIEFVEDLKDQNEPNEEQPDGPQDYWQITFAEDCRPSARTM